MSTGRRLAPGGVRCAKGGLEPSSAWKRERRPRQFWVQRLLVRRVSTQFWMRVTMRCFGWGPSYEFNLYLGNTWPLEVVAWWFRKSSGVCEIVARTKKFQMTSFFNATE